MSFASAASTVADPVIAAAIERAEHRRANLERMTEVGMELVEQVGAHAAAAMAAINEARGGDPCRAFAAVSRAVRMTLGLETRLDQYIIALRNGDSKPAGKPGRGAAAIPASLLPDGGSKVAAPPSPERLRVRNAVWEAIYREVETIDEAQRVLDRLDIGLFDTPDWDAVLSGPLRGAVAAICADLGLAPDWSLWSDDVGFMAASPGRRVIWSALCKHRPPGADPP